MNRAVPHNIVNGMGPRADDTHVPANHVIELWYLVDAVPANKAAKGSYRLIIGDLECRTLAVIAFSQPLLRLVRIRDHRAKLVAFKGSPSFSDAQRLVKNGSLGITFDRQGYEDAEGQ